MATRISLRDRMANHGASWTCGALAAVFALAPPAFVHAQTGATISAGSDLWTTVHGGGQTFQDFSGSPIPADFFRPRDGQQPGSRSGRSNDQRRSARSRRARLA